MKNLEANFTVEIPPRTGGISVVDSIELKESCEKTICEVLKYYEEETGLYIRSAVYFLKSDAFGVERFTIDVDNPYYQHTIDKNIANKR